MKKLIRITTVPISLDKLLGEQLRFMSVYYNIIGVSADENQLKKVASKYNISHYPVEMTRKITPLKDLIAVWKMYRFFVKEKPYMVHSHTPKAGIVGMLAARWAGVPHRIHTVAGLPLIEAGGIKRIVLDIVEKMTYACATKVYPNSKGLYDFILKNRYTSDDKLMVIANGSSNGINTSYFSTDIISENTKDDLRKTLFLLESDFVFIFVGRLVGDKGINEMVDSFKDLQGDFEKRLDKPTDALKIKPKLLLVGPFEEDLDRLLSETLTEIERNPDIISVGFQEDVRPYFAISDALVFPSYREGFPNVVMQAGAMGIPSIVTDINGCNEIIKNNQNGIIIPPKNTLLLKDAMIKLMIDSNLYVKLKSNARVMIKSRYEQQIVWEALLNEYQKLENNV